VKWDCEGKQSRGGWTNTKKCFQSGEGIMSPIWETGDYLDDNKAGLDKGKVKCSSGTVGGKGLATEWGHAAKKKEVETKL